ncbi:MAG: hypothetical protein LBR33_04790 [Propionibacteriaceae bacterium]|jgi:hypothetical protein|nr:hypothetical protein [Propionibacteriaceae bacterium]
MPVIDSAWAGVAVAVVALVISIVSILVAVRSNQHSKDSEHLHLLSDCAHDCLDAVTKYVQTGETLWGVLQPYWKTPEERANRSEIDDEIAVHTQVEQLRGGLAATRANLECFVAVADTDGARDIAASARAAAGGIMASAMVAYMSLVADARIKGEKEWRQSVAYWAETYDADDLPAIADRALRAWSGEGTPGEWPSALFTLLRGQLFNHVTRLSQVLGEHQRRLGGLVRARSPREPQLAAA